MWLVTRLSALQKRTTDLDNWTFDLAPKVTFSLCADASTQLLLTPCLLVSFRFLDKLISILVGSMHYGM